MRGFSPRLGVGALAALAALALGASACTRMHAFRLDRLTEPVLVTSSAAPGAYKPIAFVKVVRWRFDPGSFFRADYESPVGFQILNDYLVKKAVALGADAVVDVRHGYGGGLLFAHAWMEGMAVKREAAAPAPSVPRMPPVLIPPPVPGSAPAAPPEPPTTAPALDVSR